MKQLKIWPAIQHPMMLTLALAFIAGSVISVGATTSKANGSKKPNIVLVHGAWADGSCWSTVIQRLQEDGYNVIAPQFPLTSLADNVARLREVLAVQDGPTIVVGHSYGGQIITALGTDAPNVVGLVYIAAFALDQGESIGGLPQQGPPPPAIANLRIDAQGFAWLPQSDFVNYFAADVERQRANVMYAVQQPLSHRRKITFRIRSMLAKQVGHDQVYRRTASHENNKEKAHTSMSMSCL